MTAQSTKPTAITDLICSQSKYNYLAYGRGTLRNFEISEVHHTFNSHRRTFVGKNSRFRRENVSLSYAQKARNRMGRANI